MLNRIGFRNKILLSIAGLVILLGITAIIFANTVLRAKLVEKLEDRGISIARHLASNSITPILTEKYFELEMIAKDFMKSEEDIEYIFALDRHGDVLMHTFEGGFPTELKNINRPEPNQNYTRQDISTAKGEHVDMAVPLQHGQAGVIHIGFSKKHITEDIRSITKLILWTILGLSAVGIGLAILLTQVIMKPVSELVKAVEKVGRGELDQRVAIYSEDEIGQLGRTFNAMIERRKEIEQALHKSEGKYRSLVESTVDSIYLVDTECNYLFINRNHLERMGLSGGEYQGRAYGDFHSDDETRWFIENVNTVITTDTSVQHRHQSSRDGSYFLQTLSPVRDVNGKVIAVTVVSKDITELELLEEKLKTLSVTDELTGLYNRRGFLTLAEQGLRLANRNKTGAYMLYVDLDGLKNINDTFGHKAGDLALVEMATILKNSFRDSDAIGRIGGDEFVVYPAGTTEATAELVSIRLYENLKIFNDTSPHAFKLAASVGISYYDPSNPSSLDELLMEADKNMYVQKNGKRAS
ncbi:MAG: hypothetical protein C0402_11000 [Thermodesulfovibrio sp.]|nr:hypothetical protein [Thermodesulfovibrio sp.]